MTNCIVSGNSATGDRGGGIYSWSDLIVNNSIIVGNKALYGGGIYKSYSGLGEIRNCILWGNIADFGGDLALTGTSEAMIGYSNVHGDTSGVYVDAGCTLSWGAGNINTDPGFVGNPYDSWTWSHDAVYNSGTFQTVLTDITAGQLWEPGEMAGKLLNPDMSQVLQFLIVDNTETQILVWGDASEIAQARDNYEIYDYRLADGSPCIDAGDSSAYAGMKDLDGNFRYVNSTDKPGWNEDIDFIYKNGADDVTLLWKGLIDIGAYEYQVSVPTYETFTVQAREAMDAGEWSDIFSGNVGTWTDTGAGDFDSRFYRVRME